jgi:hypothetical protein
MQTITPEQLLTCQWTMWKKTAITRIKKILTQADIESEPATFFFDLEGRRHEVAIGRCICVGIEGERWSCSLESLERDRYPVGDEDAQRYRPYKMRNPRPVRCFDLMYPFVLIISQKSPWQCPDEEGAIITWNGEIGDKLDMRVVKRSVFLRTYKHA